MSSIKINQAIYVILTGSTGLTTIVSADKMFPIVVDDKIKNPYIAYERIAVLPTYSKDGLLYDECKVQVGIVSDDYNESLEIADLVRDALELVKGTYVTTNIAQCHLFDAKENWGIDGFMQYLTFRIVTTS